MRLKRYRAVRLEEFETTPQPYRSARWEASARFGQGAVPLRQTVTRRAHGAAGVEDAVATPAGRQRREVPCNCHNPVCGGSAASTCSRRGGHKRRLRRATQCRVHDMPRGCARRCPPGRAPKGTGQKEKAGASESRRPVREYGHRGVRQIGFPPDQRRRPPPRPPPRNLTPPPPPARKWAPPWNLAPPPRNCCGLWAGL